MTVDTEEIFVLYSSQTGNSESAAEEITSLLPSKLSSSSKKYKAKCMQLDDFLEIERAAWTRLVIIVTSSYGVGQAPLGGYKFRELCDYILSEKGTDINNLLKGINYALLGLGDSKYTTFFKNPTTLDNALTKAGATRIGPLGKADASGTGDMEQGKIIQLWVDGIWSHLNEVLKGDGSPEGLDLLKSKDDSSQICAKIFEDWDLKGVTPSGNQGLFFAKLSILPILLSLVAYFLLKEKYL
eukprot:CAMPEP_0184870544 /NCGR_PEP_ID=MMETSP0580-20130426/37865_1 /TAXON_ID=1118495 /ORGANISM="Dactyliosolen fragilissimus" /LENGTH=240 /DNA_ID=CAMNT_0027372669 /DNA_START=21 /DNA_END=743 /DNA_ORIENTATION=-